MIFGKPTLPIMLFTEDDGFYYPRQSNGYNQFVLPSDVRSIISDLIHYCDTYTDEEIQEINLGIEKTFFDDFNKVGHINNNQKSNSCVSGYVYLLKCADKYKIGFSKDVDRRVKQLDIRPFKIKLLATWESPVALKIEKELHKIFKDYSVENEWYCKELPVYKLDEIICELEALICDTQ